MFLLASRITKEHGLAETFDLQIIEVPDLAQAKGKKHIIILPPNIVYEYYLARETELNRLIVKQQKQGAVNFATCSGAFILASTGLLNNRPATTHWGLSDQLKTLFSEVEINTEKIIINDGDLITAGGSMSWMD
tara:strand:+ start:41 stop:442 length:402 start_codon:yes stop_codon:yes gene_type:complete